MRRTPWTAFVMSSLAAGVLALAACATPQEPVERYAALVATGYIHSPGTTIRGAGATHAWCEVFLPDLGWLEFDPTNGLAESPDLIRVAATRTPAQALPVSGAIIGDPGSSRLHVSVDVRLVDEIDRAA